MTDFNPIEQFPVMTPYGPATCITRLNRVHLTHIARYIESGWLPKDYDPARPETWPL